MSTLRPASSAEPAAWIIERTRGFAENVGSLLPHGLDGYARVLHPASTGHPDDQRVTWSEIARSTGRMLHPEAQWPHLAFTQDVSDINDLQDSPPGARWKSPPEEGTLDRDVAMVLVDILKRHTSTSERCWFAVWEGWGSIRESIRAAPTFELPGRRYLLLEGPIRAVTQTVNREEWIYQSASLWWPDDRAWCVATEVDLESTYVGGSRACIEETLNAASIEVVRAEVTHGVTWAADTVNPNPLRLDR